MAQSTNILGGVNKNSVANHIHAMPSDDKVRLLSKLVAIKYYRQAGIGYFNDVDEVAEQNRLWSEILNGRLLPEKTTLHELMEFIKNDGYLVQRKLPQELQDLLSPLSLNGTEQEDVVSHFRATERAKMCEFLTNATQQSWTYDATDRKFASPVDKRLSHTTDATTDRILVPTTPLFQKHTIPTVTPDPEVLASQKAAQLDAIHQQLTPEARQIFAPLFSIASIGKIDADSPLVSGDTDGSTARLVLLGIQSGIIDINKEGMVHLAQLIEAEATLLQAINTGKGGSLSGFQGNKELQETLEKLFSCLIFKKGDTQFIHIGDGAHDRHSVNKDVDVKIREAMYALGAIFIRGNHDSSQFTRNNLGWEEAGIWAKNNISDQDWETHETLVFRNAYYDQKSNTLYIHHGLQFSRDKKSLITAFDSCLQEHYRLNGKFDPTAFVTWLNKQPVPESNFNSFRPKDKEMEELGKILGVRIVHGHTGDCDLSGPRVVNLNSRKEDGKERVMAAALVGSPA